MYYPEVLLNTLLGKGGCKAVFVLFILPFLDISMLEISVELKYLHPVSNQLRRLGVTWECYFHSLLSSLQCGDSWDCLAYQHTM
jgi:hypothetical protein